MVTKSAKAQQSQLGKVKDITYWILKMPNAKQDLVIDMQSVSNLIAVWKRSHTLKSQKHGCWLLNEVAAEMLSVEMRWFNIQEHVQV